MRIFIAGATGVLGIRVVPLLVAGGHEVWGMTRTPSKADTLRAVGAEPSVCDVYDLPVLRDAIVDADPEMVMHLLTDLPDDVSAIDGFVDANARIRREGTRNLLRAARAADATRFLAESVAWELPGDAGKAVTELERAVLHVGGVVLRYGQFYGPGTYHEERLPDRPRIHVDEAARRTAAAIDRPSGALEIVDG
ncbi:MAG: NAD-dependent epimerase/dehydratase family protein [Actinomycetota bacterium]